MTRLLVAGLLIGLAVLFAALPANQPKPEIPDSPVNLRGLFVGPDAAADAATTAGLIGELADKIEIDGQKAEPRLKTGVAFDDLRTAARDVRCNGQTLGSKHPRVRDAIKAHLNAAVGDSGGEVDADRRARWVQALRDIEAAAEAAAR